MLRENLINIYEASFRENHALPALTDYFKQESFTYLEMGAEIAKLHLLFDEAGIRQGDLISAQSTASSGDVKLILDELVNVMRRNLGKGEVVKVGELGSFQLQFGSTGTLTEKEFNSALIKSKRILFRPGKQLRDAISNYTFEKIVPETPSTPSGGGEEERPGEL